MVDRFQEFFHDEDPQLFQEAVTFTEADTGFSSRIIEKDYYCSLILNRLFSDPDREVSLIFKGGTCLSKVYVDFYRLSEDLDFVIPVVSDSPRQSRSKKMEGVKKLFSELPNNIPQIEIKEDLRGHNESRQYIGYIEYPSCLFDRKEQIKIEIGLREPLFLSSAKQPAKTIIENPFTGKPLLPLYSVNAIALEEGYAEKIRAALSRKVPAIRDFFDLLYAKNNLNLDYLTDEFIQLVEKKLAIPGNHPVNISAERKQILRKQVDTELRSVLRPSDFRRFDLDESFRIVLDIAAKLKDY
jgi:predicted nucleotidyltransferase component of viral defense system